jgi:hypothetical protein
MSRLWRLRAAVLTLVGALGVHEGRYLFAPPEHEHALADAHAYLGWVVPLAGALLFLAVVQVGVRIGRPEGEGTLPAARALWLGATASLLTVFGAQECAEAFLSHGHLPLLADVLGAGGWVAIPLCIAAGGLVALLLKGAAEVLRRALARRAPRRPPVATVCPRAHAAVLVPRASVLARQLAGRAPPALS